MLHDAWVSAKRVNDRNLVTGNQMILSDSDVIPFKLTSLALFKARENDTDGTYQKWRKLLKEFDKLRSRVDPLADQNANLDILLRSFEDHLASHLKVDSKVPDDSAGIQIHIQLSRLWVLGTYEIIRSLHQLLRNSPIAACLKSTGKKACGASSCIVCSIGHLKNEFAIARMVIAKGESAGDVKNPPLPPDMKERLLAVPEDIAPPVSRFLVEGEGMTSGIICWFQLDQRIEQKRLITRRALSDMILSWPEPEGEADLMP
jgi:hypothetical protein